MSIHAFPDKIKGFFMEGWGRELITLLLFASAILASFLLGKSSISEVSETPVLVTYTGVEPPKVQHNSVSSSSGGADGGFVAAKTGSKYYPAGCGSVKRIKSENRVSFKTESEAQAAGYTRTTSCK